MCWVETSTIDAWLLHAKSETRLHLLASKAAKKEADTKWPRYKKDPSKRN